MHYGLMLSPYLLVMVTERLADEIKQECLWTMISRSRGRGGVMKICIEEKENENMQDQG